MSDPPRIPVNITHLYINFTSIQIHIASADNATGWYNVTKKGTIDLKMIMNVSTVIGSVNLPVGKYNLVRFNITSAIVTTEGKNYTATISAGKMTIPIGKGEISIEAAKITHLLIDIEPRVTGSAKTGFHLTPSAKATQVTR